jgi:hypothetical protein
MSEQYRRFRVESGDPAATEEYRIVEGAVEVRGINNTFDKYVPISWLRLTPEQLSVHVERNTAVAQWLERCLGWRKLLLACVGEGFFIGSTERDSRKALRD